MPRAALACHDLVGRGERWLFGTRGEAESAVDTGAPGEGRLGRGPAAEWEPGRRGKPTPPLK